MRCARLIVTTCVLLATMVRADGSYEWLSQPPGVVHDAVWQQTIGFALVMGKNATVFPTFERVGEELRPTGKTIALGQLLPLSDGGYHPPDSKEDSNQLRLAVVGLRGAFVQVIVEPRLGRAMWLEKQAFDAVVPFTELKPGCCVQLLHLPGAERVEVHAQPRDDSKVLRAFNPPKTEWERTTLEILEVRGGWLKVGNHFNPITHPTSSPQGALIAGEPEGFQREPGWVRMRDEKGRLVFWVVNPDTC